MKTHYHVTVNMAGYLPMSDEPNVYRTLTDARAAAQWEADSYRDMIADSEGDDRRVTGNKRDGYTIDAPSPYSLPTYISIWECTDDDCEEDLPIA